MTIACVTSRNSQNVRLKEEVVLPLLEYQRPRGVSQQHVVSVGAWFYMCLPDALTKEIGIAFYEWCKGRPGKAIIPKDIPPLLSRTLELINTECAMATQRVEQEEARSDAEFLAIMLGQDDATIKKAADSALDAAAEKLQKREKKKKQPLRGKAPKNL